MKTGLEQITEERVKQITKHGYIAYHDAQHTNKELASAALAYLSEALLEGKGIEIWPFEKEYWKPENYVENLKKAGAFIAAELDRLQIN